MPSETPLTTLYPGFDHRQVDVGNGVKIAMTIGGSGPPLLLLHGHPQTRALWHRVAQQLANEYTIVAVDLRGYGDSSKPVGEPGHENYSKRTMAQDQITLMSRLGFERFDVLAHDRGARVAHRLAMDHPAAIRKLVLLDIAPTLSMYEQTTQAFARHYWHWFFLIQPAPLPERLILADPVAYLHDVMGRRSAGMAPFDSLALAEYERCIALPETAHGLCEDYRASATIDLVHDQADRDGGLILQTPLLVLWGKQGVVHRCFTPLDDWKQIASQVEGEALDCGHYMAEEAAKALLDRVLPFLSRDHRQAKA